MLEWLKPVLDPYDRKARLKPGLFCGVPLAASVVLLIPELGADSNFNRDFQPAG